jgi:hypothetical protein
VNTGEAVWEGGTLYVYGGAAVENRGAFEARAAATLATWGNGPWRLINSGTFRRVGEGLLNVNVQVENTGTLEAASGTLRLSRESHHRDAALHAAAGARLELLGGTHTLAGTLAGEPEGDLVFAGGTLRVDEDAPATIDYGGTGFQWHAANLQADGVLTNAGLLTLSTTASKSLQSGVLRNAGSLVWAAGTVYLYGGALLDNAGTLTADAATLATWGTGDWRLRNAGTLRRTAGGALNVNVHLENAGTVEAQRRHHPPEPHERARRRRPAHRRRRRRRPARGLRPRRPRTAPRGARGGGRPRLHAHRRRRRLDFSGAGLVWASGYLDGSVENAGLLTLATAAAKSVRSGALVNTGEAVWEGGTLYVYGGAAVENRGAFEARAAATLATWGNGPWRFDNYGELLKTGDGTTSQIGVSVENHAGGEITLASGTLRFTRSLINAPGAVIQGDGGTLDVSAFAFSNHGVIAPGASPGLLRWVGALTAADSSRLVIELAGAEPGTEHDRLEVTGQATLGGALDLRLLDGYRPADGTEFTVLTATAGLAGGFRQRLGVVDTTAGVALYPRFEANAITLTAGPIPTLSPALAVSPATLIGDALRTLTLAGEGFAPDVEVWLACVECEDPGAFGEVPGLVASVTPMEVSVAFDLSGGRAIGAYEVVVTDPRGGEARAPVTIVEGALVVSVRAVRDRASEQDAEVGAFLVRANRPVLRRVLVPFELGGTARPFQDFVIGRRAAPP